MRSAASTSRSDAPDPWQADVAAVREMLDAVSGAETAEVKLPVMSTAELYALNALADHPLTNVHSLAWWIAQPDQDTLARRAFDHVVQRGLIDAETGRADPHLALIALGRSHPTFIALCRESSDGDPVMMRLFGIADATAGLRAVLVETVSPDNLRWAGPAYDFTLSGAQAISGDLAEWAAEREGRTIDVYVPGPVRSGSWNGLPARRFTSAAGESASELADLLFHFLAAAGRNEKPE